MTPGDPVPFDVPVRPARPARSRAGTGSRRGATLAGVLATLSFAGVLATTAIVFTPRYLTASPGSTLPEPVLARTAAHRKTVEMLAAVLSRSRAVLTVHPRGASPYLEFVLWLEDQANRGVIDVDEIGVLCHSEVMRTVVLYTRADDETGLDALDPAPPVAERIEPSDITRPDFCAAWRDRPDVTPRVLVTGLERMSCKRLAIDESDVETFWITLIWSAESVDGRDEASVIVETAGPGSKG